MFVIKPYFVLFLIIFHVTYCERRILDGEEVSVDKKYMVYIVKAPASELIYDYWLCGGALVSEYFVITSAACVNDVDYLYVISGYREYVTDDKIEINNCTKEMKKKIIYTCSPQGYVLKYDELDYWSYIDIALAKVESPFNFTDERYEAYCHYMPTTIAINYESKYQQPGTDALVLGWGHNESWRKPGDDNNYNQRYLRYAPTLIMNKSACMGHFKDYPNMTHVIDDYMICSLGKGNVDDAGETIHKSYPILGGCTTMQMKVLGYEGESCEEDRYQISSELENRRSNVDSFNQTHNDSSVGMNRTKGHRRDWESINIGNAGICQNDHGGPIVTWAGAREILIGIASVFKVSERSECMGPYLYTSTLCTGLFLDCILSTAQEQEPDREHMTRRDLCNRPAKEKGYETIERHISWKGHPAGPADNEKGLRHGKHKKIPPNIRNPPNERYAVNVENGPNERYTPNIKYAPNERYSENIKNVPINIYPTNINSAPHGMNPLNANYAPNQRYPENKNYGPISSYPENKNYGPIPSYPENKRPLRPLRD